MLSDLLGKGGFLVPAHEHGDPFTTAFNDGRRSMALVILDGLRWSEGQVLTLVTARETDWDPTGPARVDPEQADEFEDVV